MNEAQFENQVRRLLAEACGSAAALREGVDLLESGLLDSLAFITLLTAWRTWAWRYSPPRWSGRPFARRPALWNCAKPLRERRALWYNEPRAAGLLKRRKEE